ncbi:MAG: hypothetical protein ACRD01_09535 [Terriglobales bacterium]
MVTALAALAAALASGWQWVTRHIIRDEVGTIREDIEVLRVAVFNHLRHGDLPDEAAIRLAVKGARHGRQ